MMTFMIEYSLKKTDAHTQTFTHTRTHNVILSHTCSNNPDFTTAAQAACFDNNTVGRKHFQTTDPCLTAALLSLTNATQRPFLIKQDVIIFHSPSSLLRARQDATNQTNRVKQAYKHAFPLADGK